MYPLGKWGSAPSVLQSLDPTFVVIQDGVPRSRTLLQVLKELQHAIADMGVLFAEQRAGRRRQVGNLDSDLFLVEGEGSVRNMGNFNLFQTHVLTFFHHVEQCCYPSFLILPHIPAMTSHVAYVIHVTFTLITTQRLWNITFSFMSFSLMHLGPYSSYVHYLFPSSHIHVALLTLYRIRNQVYLSTRNRSRLNVILEGFLKTT